MMGIVVLLALVHGSASDAQPTNQSLVDLMVATVAGSTSSSYSLTVTDGEGPFLATLPDPRTPTKPLHYFVIWD